MAFVNSVIFGRKLYFHISKIKIINVCISVSINDGNNLLFRPHACIASYPVFSHYAIKLMYNRCKSNTVHY